MNDQRVWFVLLITMAAAACGDPRKPNGSGGGSGDSGAGGEAGTATATAGHDSGASDQGGMAGGRNDLLTKSQLALGTEFGCAIDSQGALVCWGSDDQKTGQTEPRSGTYVQIRAGDQTACAIQADNTFACWGMVSTVSQGTDTTDLQVLAGQICLLRTDETIRCVGAAAGAQTGPFTRVAAGGGFGCGLRADGTVLCWGDDSHGMVSNVPAGKFAELTAGTFHACAIRGDDQSVVCWGAGDADDPNGQDPDQIAFGQAVSPVGKFVSLAAGLAHSCGIRDDSSVECWGAGTTVDNCGNTVECGQSDPPSGAFVQVACGTSNTCGIKGDGSLVCWGSNTGSRSTPPADFRAF